MRPVSSDIDQMVCSSTSIKPGQPSVTRKIWDLESISDAFRKVWSFLFLIWSCFKSSFLSCCDPTTLPPYPVIKQNQGGGVLGWTSDKGRKHDNACEHRLINPYSALWDEAKLFKNSIRGFLTLKGWMGLMWNKKEESLLQYYTVTVSVCNSFRVLAVNDYCPTPL